MSGRGLVPLAIAMTAAIRMAAPAAQSARMPAFTTDQPVAKVFSLRQHYRYFERRYAPEVAVAFVDKEPQRPQTPEEALASQVSAMRAGNVDWWLRTWDATSRAEMERGQSATADSLKRDWAALIGRNARLTLVRWIATGEYVLLSYASADPRGRSAADERVAVFRLSGEGWKATTRLNDDPVVLHFRDETRVFERTVR
jgi:hypothetical protein